MNLPPIQQQLNLRGHPTFSFHGSGVAVIGEERWIDKTIPKNPFYRSNIKTILDTSTNDVFDGYCNPLIQTFRPDTTPMSFVLSDEKTQEMQIYLNQRFPKDTFRLVEDQIPVFVRPIQK